MVDMNLEHSQVKRYKEKMERISGFEVVKIQCDQDYNGAFDSMIDGNTANRFLIVFRDSELKINAVLGVQPIYSYCGGIMLGQVEHVMHHFGTQGLIRIINSIVKLFRDNIAFVMTINENTINSLKQNKFDYDLDILTTIRNPRTGNIYSFVMFNHLGPKEDYEDE